MLTIYGMTLAEQSKDKDVIQTPNNVFDGMYDDSWLESLWSRRLITDIQDIDVTDMTMSTRRILLETGLRPEDLAGGTKNILCARYLPWDGFKIRMGKMGSNCFKWLMDVADTRDIVATTTIFLDFKDSDLRGRPVYFGDLDKYARTNMEFFNCILDLKELKGVQ